MAINNNGVPSSPINFTDSNPSSRVFIGTAAPTNPTNGDIWIDSNPLNNAGKNLFSTVTLSGSAANLAVPSIYKDVAIVIRGITASASATLSVTLNADTAANYAGQVIGGSSVTTALFQIPLSANVTSNGLILWMEDTQDSASWQFASLQGNNGSIINTAALYKTPAAISTVNLSLSSGTMSGTALVYGVN
jgi:hypothetical protein